MRRPRRIAIAVTVGLLLATAMSAYAWDASQADRIADRVLVGEVELGGLSEDEARRLLRRELIEPLERPLHIRYGERRFTLPAERLEVRADVDGIAAEALAAGREGGLPARLWRYATGGEVEHSIEPRVSYSREAVEGFVAEVAAEVDRAPRDATIAPTTASLNPVAARAGVALRQGRAIADLIGVLEGGAGSRTVEARVEKVAPEVTTDELAAAHPTYITVDRASFKLRLFRNLKLAETYTIAVGQLGYDTDPGLYAVQSKQVNPSWYVPESDWAGDLAGQVIPGGDPRNPLAARWMGFNGAEGIHGTTDLGSLGTAASHGCIRMAVPDVVELYDRVSVGTPVYVE